MDALFDTNILIDYLNGIAAAKEELARYRTAYISQITWVEVMVGADPEEESVVRGFLSRFVVVPIDEDVSEAAVRIRRFTRLRVPDAIIRATAEIRGVIIVTRNSRDFDKSDPSIRVPYVLTESKQ